MNTKPTDLTRLGFTAAPPPPTATPDPTKPTRYPDASSIHDPTNRTPPPPHHHAPHQNQRATWDTAPREPDEYVPYRPRRRRSAAGLTFKETLKKEIATTTANRIRASLKAEAEENAAVENNLALLPDMGKGVIGKKADKQIKERRKSMKMEW